MHLIQGQSDYKIEVVIDYINGGQITQQELADAEKLEINYRWLLYDDDEEENVTYSGSWEASGYGLTSDNEAYIYYIATKDDAVPNNASKLVGRAVITDSAGLVSKGEMFEIPVYEDEL